MTEQLKVGDILHNAATHARFVVVQIGTARTFPSVNGVALSRGKRQSCSVAVTSTTTDGFRGGQRYSDTVTGLTLLCIHPGEGLLCLEGRVLRAERRTVDARRGG